MLIISSDIHVDILVYDVYLYDYSCTCFNSVLSVGFEEVQYEVSESDDFVEVCVAILAPRDLRLFNTSSVVLLLSTLYW